jgi:hypothetical protein
MRCEAVSSRKRASAFNTRHSAAMEKRSLTRSISNEGDCGGGTDRGWRMLSQVVRRNRTSHSSPDYWILGNLRRAKGNFFLHHRYDPVNRV